MLTVEQPMPPAPAPPSAEQQGRSPFLSLVVPAYNEERRLGPTLDTILAYLADRPYTSEVIVVSDGSTDGTESVARGSFGRVPDSAKVRCRFVGYVPNRGKGTAVRTGVAATAGKVVAFADADLSTPVEEIDRALAYLRAAPATLDGARSGAPTADNGTGSGTYRVVIGSRAAGGAAVERQQPLYRRLAAKLFNVLRDSIVGIRGLRDTQCGLKVFEGDLARAIFARQRIPGFMFDPETMFIAQRLGVPVYEMGVRWIDSPDSRVRLTSGLRLLPDLVRIRLMHGRLAPADLPRLLAPRATATRSAQTA